MIYNFSQFYGWGLQVGLAGAFLCCIWCWLEVTHSAWFICGWVGLEALRQFHSVVRWPSVPHMSSPRSWIFTFSQCCGLRAARLLTRKLVAKRKEGKATNSLKSWADKCQDPAHHFFHILLVRASYKATPKREEKLTLSLTQKGSGRETCAYKEGRRWWWPPLEIVFYTPSSLLDYGEGWDVSP